MTGRHLILFFAFTLLFGAAASAQTADEVVQKNIEARGGLQKIKAIKSVRATGKLTVEASGVELAITIQQKRPNAYRLDATFQGQSVIQAYDGETGWQINPFENINEPEKLIGDELRDAQEQADFDGPLVGYKAKGHTVELMGKEAVRGKPAYKLKLTLKSGDVRTIYIDAASYLELRVTTTRRVNGGLREMDIYPGDYKPADGVLFPYSIEQQVGGQMQVQIALDKVEVDAPVDAAAFKLPAKAADKPKAEEKPKDKPPAE